MKLNNENINGKRENTGKDSQMLKCVENMLDKMEYEVSCKNPDTSYISIDGLRLIFKNGVYKGWYVFEEEEEIDQDTLKVSNINKLKKMVQHFFSEYLTPIDVDIHECEISDFYHTKIIIHGDGCSNCKKYTIIFGSINYLASLPQNDFLDRLAHAIWTHY